MLNKPTGNMINAASDDTPQALGTASAGTSVRYSRADHVHASPTTIALTTGTISTTPGSSNDIVNKAYADSLASGINFHDACNYATVAALPTYNYTSGTIEAVATGALVIDGVQVSVTTPRQRILVKNETSTNAPYNGIYTVERVGSITETFQLVRSADYDTSGSGTNEIQAGDFVLVLGGNTLSNTVWVQQTPLPITVGVTNLRFTQFAAAAPGVTTFNTSLNGLTPQTNSNGAVTLGGTLGISSGGTGSNSPETALAALGGFPIAGGTITDGLTANSGTFVAFLSSPALSGTHYGDGSKLTGLNASDITGAVAISNGGTGQSSTEAATKALGGMQVAQIRHSSTVLLATAGTITGGSWTSGSAILTFTSSSVTLVPGMSVSASGFLTAVIKTVNSATQVTMSSVSINTSTATVTVYNSTTTTLVTNTVVPMDGRTMVVGDIFVATSQIATAQNGPWKIDSIGTGFNCSRPSWFAGTLVGPILVQIQYGAGNTGTIVSVQSSATLLTGSITIGIDPISPLIAVGGRLNTAGTSSNIFTGPQTLRATAAGAGQCPLILQPPATTNTIMTSAQAHAVEWDGSLLYLTQGVSFNGYISGTTLTVSSISNGVVSVGQFFTSSNVIGYTKITGFTSGTPGGAGLYTVDISQTAGSSGSPILMTAAGRTTNAAFVPVPASATAQGIAGQIAYDAGYMYVCTATNTWKRTALSTWV